MLATMTRGYVTVPRLETDLLGDEQELTQTHRGAWLWLFDKAAWKRCVDRFGRFTVELQRGEIACSYRFLARAWNWSHGKVQRWLALLAERGKITMRTDQGIVVIALNGYAESKCDTQKPTAAAVESHVDDRRVSPEKNTQKDSVSKRDAGLVRFAPKRVVPSPTATPEGRKQRRVQQVMEWINQRLHGAARSAAMLGLMSDGAEGDRWLNRLCDEMKAEAARA
jgi:hypothetical protein